MVDGLAKEEPHDKKRGKSWMRHLKCLRSCDASFRLKDAGIFPFPHKPFIASMWFSGMSGGSREGSTTKYC